MKILHAADIHLGVKYGSFDKYKQNLLKDEIVYNIRNFFDIAKQQAYDVILICGDLFHSKTISSKYVKMFFDAVEKFGNPVLYISGNHDENFVLPSTLPDNFIVLNDKNFVFSYGDFDFYSDIKENTILSARKNNILIKHGNIENQRDSDYFDIKNYLNKGFDYIALGHVHQFKIYEKDKDVFAYPGSLFSTGFDENGVKGYINLDIEDKIINKLEFCPLSARKFVVCECEISGLISNKEICQKIEKTLKNQNVDLQDIVRVVLIGQVSEDCEKSIYLLENKFEDYFYFEIQDKTTLKIDIEKVKKEKLSFKYEFISLLEESDLDNESKRLISEIGLQALKGEDIII